ncbi:HAD-superfamily hydrolase, subfamily IA, variant 1 [Astrocystis sublimbata]|nr:HAD-superfamily hydrolase, subfamily IA, variant 1 [Astrocystis sublimbata]
MSDAAVLRLRESLAGKPWIGFDLDDTLHEFRSASSAASLRVLTTLHERYGVPVPALQSRYAEVLRASTSNAFADGRSSVDYRRERFLAVASHFALPLERDHDFLAQLLRCYESSLQESLKLKSGALSLLRTIKHLGKKVVVITEGPQDAQEWTIANLGMTPFVDFLATTSHFKVSKIDGLYAKVLETLGIGPSEVAYVGDSEDRDMKPAMAQDILCFHLVESLNCNLEVYPPRINSLNALERLLTFKQSDTFPE